MQPTTRLRVLSDRIPRVLVFVQVIRKYRRKAHTSGLHRDINVPHNYLTSRRVQKESRSHGNEREADRARGQDARPSPLGARPATVTNQLQLRGSCSTDLILQGKPHDQCRFDPTAQIHLKRLYNQTPQPLEEAPLDHYSLFIDRAKARVQR